MSAVNILEQGLAIQAASLPVPDYQLEVELFGQWITFDVWGRRSRPFSGNREEPAERPYFEIRRIRCGDEDIQNARIEDAISEHITEMRE